MDKETKKWAKKKKVLGVYSKTNRQVLMERRRKLIKEIREINNKISHGRKYTLTEALNKTYKVRTKIKGNNQIGGKIDLPICFIDKFVKLRLVSDGGRN